MAKGYFIREHDKTTCGGKVLEADTSVMMFGIAHARVGDRVSCGKDNKTYVIEGGVSYIESNGRLVAGSLDSYSSCPCKAELIPSFFTGSYESSRSAAPHAMRTATPQAAPATSSPVPRSSGFAPAPTPPSSMLGNSAQVAEPGFYIVPKSTTREQLEAWLFTLRDPAVMGKFKLLNPNLRDVKAGSMIVLSDPNNYQCTREEALLMDVAARTNQILETLTPEEADFMVQHRDAIQTILGLGSKAIGIGASIFKNNLDNVSDTLKKIEALHQHSFLRDGHLSSPTFLAERQKLLAQLDGHLTSLTRKGIGFPDHPNLNRAMFLSPPSLVHRWTDAGGVGQIPGYATHLEGVAKASKYLKYGGWVGTAVGGGASAMKVQDVCSAGNSEACERVRFTETGSFAGGVTGGAMAGAMLTTSAVGGLCIGIGVATAGVGLLACNVIAVGIGSYAGSTLGEVGGEIIGEIVYESLK
ncbi:MULTISPECIES: PAAR domain-containing protein [Pseudomonas]|uniref:PAAR domain-containing protein n=1 Tax=Pseudomonas sp. MIL9 TaxID=2807620 RepID=UPI00102A7620|nr:PAAR domain-containing protein [Pseudomonas sp. MIL9]MBM6447944.1 PAAR domain-containing protein [Pseudomonas sp. MIL9]RZO00113.1 PAAR domain-containing protein [Pseudomonas moorei]